MSSSDEQPENAAPENTMYSVGNPQADALIAAWQEGIDNGQSEDVALFSAMAKESERQEQATRNAYKADAQIVDADLRAIPMTPAPTLVRTIKHVCALTGYSFDELDEIFSAQPGTAKTIASGDIDNAFYMNNYFSMNFLLFVNISRRVFMTFPGQSVRQWWETPTKGKKLPPLQLLKEHRLRKKIGEPYLAMLDCNGQVCSQLMASNGHDTFLEFNFGVTFR